MNKMKISVSTQSDVMTNVTNATITLENFDLKSVNNIVEYLSGGMFYNGAMKDRVLKLARQIPLYGSSNMKISLIKAHRELTNVGLKESKDWVEANFGDAEMVV
jgi:ribosomal protein L7/L12